jgi:hypothetical protein
MAEDSIDLACKNRKRYCVDSTLHRQSAFISSKEIGYNSRMDNPNNAHKTPIPIT